MTFAPASIAFSRSSFIIEAENKKARLAAEQMESDQISFDKISDSIVTDRLRKTNIDEMTDSELRDFVKDLLRYV